MLLSKGLIRVGIGIPSDADFDVVAVDDPYGYASAQELSLFRRPLPSTNLKFLSSVMWDGRETFIDPLSKDCIFGTSKCFALLHSIFPINRTARPSDLRTQLKAVQVTWSGGDAPLAQLTNVRSRAVRVTAQGRPLSWTEIANYGRSALRSIAAIDQCG